MKTTLIAAAGLFCVTLPFCASTASAITFGQLDDFQDGGVAAWRHAAPAPMPPFNVADVGPMGVGDHALQVDSLGGSGAGSRLLMRNTDQWTGDYVSAGVTAVEAEMINLNTVPLAMRFAVNGDGGRFVSADPIILTPGMGWEHVVFPITSADLSGDFGGGGFDVDATLASVSEVRILHNPNPEWVGAVIDADFRIDNILATKVVPEPASVALGLVAVIGICIASASRRGR